MAEEDPYLQIISSNKGLLKVPDGSRTAVIPTGNRTHFTGAIATLNGAIEDGKVSAETLETPKISAVQPKREYSEAVYERASVVANPTETDLAYVNLVLNLNNSNQSEVIGSYLDKLASKGMTNIKPADEIISSLNGFNNTISLDDLNEQIKEIANKRPAEPIVAAVKPERILSTHNLMPNAQGGYDKFIPAENGISPEAIALVKAGYNTVKNLVNQEKQPTPVEYHFADLAIKKSDPDAYKSYAEFLVENNLHEKVSRFANGSFIGFLEGKEIDIKGLNAKVETEISNVVQEKITRAAEEKIAAVETPTPPAPAAETAKEGIREDTLKALVAARDNLLATAPTQVAKAVPASATKAPKSFEEEEVEDTQVRAMFAEAAAEVAAEAAAEVAANAALPVPTAANSKLIAENTNAELEKLITIDAEITYGAFARKHGTTVDALNDLNGLDVTAETLLAKGSELYLPEQNVAVAAATKPEKSATAPDVAKLTQENADLKAQLEKANTENARLNSELEVHKAQNKLLVDENGKVRGDLKLSQAKVAGLQEHIASIDSGVLPPRAEVVPEELATSKPQPRISLKEFAEQSRKLTDGKDDNELLTINFFKAQGVEFVMPKTPVIVTTDASNRIQAHILEAAKGGPLTPEKEQELIAKLSEDFKQGVVTDTAGKDDVRAQKPLSPTQIQELAALAKGDEVAIK